MELEAIGWTAIALLVFPLAYLAWSFVAVDRNQLVLIKQNLSRTQQNPGEGEERKSDFTALARRLMSGSYAARLDRLLAMAGRPAAWPMDRVIVSKPIASLILGGIGVLFFLANPATPLFILTAVLLVLGFFLPDLLVYNTGIKRQEAIQLELPNILDQLLISVEAGLGFESAMARVAATSPGPMAQEMSRALQEMQLGRSRADAYAALADRTSVAELKSFVRAVIQADRYGIGIVRVLRSQASQMRVRRRQRAEEKAMKLPVKILFPLLMFIFPVLFIVILGPAVINILESGIFG
ncbi:secretion system protein [Arthrobacter sp. UCD-GKA]|uniref:type II secretion system F family protein n=1 Tax=Arthrobacter sp. UCD-GKA TaxID=1913576 RepID=UPI0008DD9087|nr:type II secretion system F family protein [Arthrobacter sp. UCD-GKA]OIH82904.1 secretion system protein [Arthrobacter sp. UCD-GKA]